MAQSSTKIAQVGLIGEEKWIALRWDSGRAFPQAGQYFLGTTLGGREDLAQTLYPCGSRDGQLLLTGEIPPHWLPGNEIKLRGPSGHGFKLPSGSRRTAFLPLSGPGVHLMPMVNTALEQGAAVTWLANNVLEPLPPAVEVSPTESLSELWDWADYFCVSCSANQIPDLRSMLQLGTRRHPPCEAQILVLSPMPCGGIADCGVCAVGEGRKAVFTCKEGPVFSLSSLLESIS